MNGLIAAAGQSTRASGCKLLYSWDKSTIIESLITKMKTVCGHVYVVTGAWHEQMQPVLDGINDVSVIFHEHWQDGMITSIKKGMQECRGSDVLYTPADYPAISVSTYKLTAENGRSAGRICRPIYNNAAGPPVFLPAAEVIAFLDSDMPVSFRSWLEKRDFSCLDCRDKWILEDIDTDEDYSRCLLSAKKYKVDSEYKADYTDKDI